jgi:hypothetical protein
MTNRCYPLPYSDIILVRVFPSFFEEEIRGNKLQKHGFVQSDNFCHSFVSVSW